MTNNKKHLKKLLKEYQVELDYYLKTDNLTSSLMLYAALIMFDPKKLTDHNLDISGWEKVDKVVKEIGKKVDIFISMCWHDIYVKNDNENSCSQFLFPLKPPTSNYRKIDWKDKDEKKKKTSLLSMYTAGRILMTISPDISKSDRYISIVGDGTSFSSSPPGIQGMHGKKEEILEYLNTIINNWNKDYYNVYRSKDVGII